MLVFLGTDCPISNGYAPELRRLWADYRGAGVDFCLTHAEPGLPLRRAAEHARAFELPGTVVHDPRLILARRFGATVVPEAVGLGPTGAVCYRGRIDDRYADYGKLRPTVTRHEVRDVLDALCAGRPPQTPHAPALGCPIQLEGIPSGPE